jgi:hypothetical protein
MTTALRRMRIIFVTLAVGALGFGASAAMAEPLRVPDCADPMANGPCVTDVGCNRNCERWVGPGTLGACNESTYCCYCIEE